MTIIMQLLVVTGSRTNQLDMEDDKQHVGPLDGKFEYKRNKTKYLTDIKYYVHSAGRNFRFTETFPA